MRDVRACASCVGLRARALASGTAAARPLSATVYRPRACTLLALAVGVRLGGGYPRSVPGHTAAEVRGLGGAPSAARCANLQAVVLSSLVETEPARSAAPLVTTTHSSVSSSVVAGLSGWRPRRLAARRKQLSIRAVAEATTAPTRKPRKPAATKPAAAKPAARKPAATKPAATKPAAKKAARPKAALPKAAPRAKAAPKKPAAGGAAAQGRAQGRARGRGRGRGRGGRGGRGRGGRGKTDQQALTPTLTRTLTLTLTLTLSPNPSAHRRAAASR